MSVRDERLQRPGPRSDAASTPSRAALDSEGHRWLSGGPDGNELLTTATGVILLLLLAALGATIVFIGQLLAEHLFLGFLLLGPMALKMASTGYRFIRYYSGGRLRVVRWCGSGRSGSARVLDGPRLADDGHLDLPGVLQLLLDLPGDLKGQDRGAVIVHGAR